MKERWKDIPEWKGRYQISDHGRVKKLCSHQRFVSKKGNEAWRLMPESIISQHTINSGYKVVYLSHLGRRKVYLIHRLVAEAFVKGRDENVNHKDGDKNNNNCKNLEWLSYSDNHIHAVKLGLRLKAIPVVGYPINKNKKIIRAPSQAEAAFRITGDRRKGSYISRHMRQERHSALGYVWKKA